MPKCMCKYIVLIQVTQEKIFKTSQKCKFSSLTFNFQSKAFKYENLIYLLSININIKSHFQKLGAEALKGERESLILHSGESETPVEPEGLRNNGTNKVHITTKFSKRRCKISDIMILGEVRDGYKKKYKNN